MIYEILEYVILGALCFAFYKWTVGRRSLTPRAALTAIGMAVIICFLLSPFYLLPLLLFFGSSVLIGKLLPSQNQAADQKQGKARDAVQVLANGGLYTLVAIVAWYSREYLNSDVLICFPPWMPDDEYLYSLYALAAIATADTWSSEIGQYFNQPTFDVVRWRRVPPGLSGGVSVAGTLAGAAGAGLISLIVLIDPFVFNKNWLIVVVIGFVGMLIDSLLGSLLQVTYRNPEDGTVLDSHVPGSHQHGGFAWVNNDVVNALSLLLGLLLFYYCLFPLFGLPTCGELL
ncbi:DUF92 domain-containing protein [Neolewinella antarctica]|uniref:Uncharacterized protein (TIGR00297 family) n=1 Tax=Neolewinella antarctica TaxID=442734 RepID=A0ABX0XCR4_9BACT|nr:DUF92 domain-containing protein [Neolewinella antarctica]NJC26713.1 uncharacterized protein (TIGR00297 family) [Neolewinella antarctica]